VSAGPLLLVTGPPGAGKSTIARLLTREWDLAVHVHTDDFYAWIASGYVEPWLPAAQHQNVTIVEAIARVADGLAEGGYAVVVDGILGPWFLDPFRALHRDVAYVVLRPTLEEAEHRAGHRGDHPLKDLSVVGQMHAAFSELGDLELHAIDSTGSTPEETVTEIHRRFAEGALTLT